MKRSKWLLSFVVFHFAIAIYSQSPDQNWVKTKTYKQPTTTAVATPDVTVANVQVSYFDGLGRPIQQIAHQQSNSGKDIITHMEYDTFGRQVKEFLPYVNTSATLLYDASASTVQNSFYASPNPYNTGNPNFEATTNPYSEKQLEASPLNRVFKQAAPGNAWAMGSGKEIKLDYQTNTASEVKFFKATATWNSGSELYNSSISSPQTYYSANELYKTITKDENWTSGLNNTTEEFKNKEGQVVLKRTYNSGDAHDTYYVYDQYGNLTYVLPPAAEGVANQIILDNLGYQYKYDYRNRLVEKKLPGKQWEFIVYDKLDRPVATGPAFSPYGGSDIGWMITEYDVFGRVTQTGWKQMTANESARQSNQTSVNTGSNPYTLATNDILTKNYYDSYAYPGGPTPPTQVEGQTIATNVKGLPTGSWTKVLDITNANATEIAYTFYDDRYRPVSTYTSNYLGGYTQVDSKLDWTGKTEYTKTYHKYDANATVLTITDRFTYSPQDKVTLHKQQINTLPEQLIAKNTYDELGQLVSKNVGGQDITGTTGLQTVDYSYNIRGWLKSINDVNNIGNDLFAFKISYNDPQDATALYNGNISETFWKTNSDNVLRKYAYDYDQLNRLLVAKYNKPDIAAYTKTLDNYQESITYDKNGNIQTLYRNGNLDTDGAQAVNTIDNLIYTYNPNNKNLLEKVTDNTNSPQGFKDGTNTDNDYSYDVNGNMIVDKNKNITSIEYNHLNLPTKLFVGTNTIEYLYNATGQKIAKKVTENSTMTTTEYLAGGFQYKGAFLQFFPHAEGYVNYTIPEYCETCRIAPSFDYVFHYSDHLGNIRVSYGVDPSTEALKIIEENHYYAFGLKHTNYNSDQYVFVNREESVKLMKGGGPILSLPTYNYKYNGKELQTELGLNTYDYGARFYEPSTGRWFSVDQMAEKYAESSPYNYGMNNPVIFVDPDGNEVQMCCDGLKGFLLAGIDNIAGSNLRNKFHTGSSEYKNGVATANSVSITAGAIIGAKGLTDIGAGTAGLAASATVTVASGGLAIEVSGPAAAASAATIGLGLTEVAIGGTILNHTMNNMREDAKSDSSSSSSSDSSSSKKTIKEQASDLKEKNGGKNSVTVKSSNGQTRYDLEGKAHNGVETPHKQSYQNNVVNGEIKSVTRTSKHAEPMTQQDIRNVNKVLKKRK